MVRTVRRRSAAHRAEAAAGMALWSIAQVAVLYRANWARWLDSSVSAKTTLKPLLSGSLKGEQVA